MLRQRVIFISSLFKVVLALGAQQFCLEIRSARAAEPESLCAVQLGATDFGQEAIGVLGAGAQEGTGSGGGGRGGRALGVGRSEPWVIQPRSNTDHLKAYLADLLERGIIGDEELKRLLGGLTQGKLINPVEMGKPGLGSAAMIQGAGIERMLREGVMNLGDLRVWVERTMAERGRVRESRERARQETKDVYRKMVYHRVQPGKFKMGEEKKIDVELTHPFLVLSTPVTQKMWVDVMGENPSEFWKGPSEFGNGDEPTIIRVVNGKPVHGQPDHPVENVTWYAFAEYLNRLSIQDGFKPAYDFSDVVFNPETRAEDGTLKMKSGKVKVNAPDGNIYLAEGYRFPTEAEMEYLLSNRGRSVGKYFWGDDEALLSKYAWYSKNSKDRTHAVDEQDPLMIDGMPFYSLCGNVWKWCHDWYDASLQGGVDPQGPENGWDRVIRGGGCYSSAPSLQSAYRNFIWSGDRDRSFGGCVLRTPRNP